jgi:flagellar capping protein FliD
LVKRKKKITSSKSIRRRLNDKIEKQIRDLEKRIEDLEEELFD